MCNINHNFYSGSDTIPVRLILQATKNLQFNLQVYNSIKQALSSCTFDIYKYE